MLYHTEQTHTHTYTQTHTCFQNIAFCKTCPANAEVVVLVVKQVRAKNMLVTHRQTPQTCMRRRWWAPTFLAIVRNIFDTLTFSTLSLALSYCSLFLLSLWECMTSMTHAGVMLNMSQNVSQYLMNPFIMPPAVQTTMPALQTPAGSTSIDCVDVLMSYPLMTLIYVANFPWGWTWRWAGCIYLISSARPICAYLNMESRIY